MKPNSNKKILLLGSTGSIGTILLESLSPIRYSIISVSRGTEKSKYKLDMTDLDQCTNFSIDEEQIDVIIFAQGLNPSKNLKETNRSHITDMLSINITAPMLILKSIENQISKNASIIFFSSVASDQGSYDPAYAAAKSSIKGLVKSLSRAYPSRRYNIIQLGLVENSRVFNQMSPDFVEKHRDKMHNNQLINPDTIVSLVELIIENDNIANSILPLTGGI